MSDCARSCSSCRDARHRRSGIDRSFGNRQSAAADVLEREIVRAFAWKRMKRATFWCAAVLVASFGLSLAYASLSGEGLGKRPWHAAPRHSAGIAPDPVRQADVAMVQIYSAATYGWRGLVAQHPWLIFKRFGATAFTRYDVIGWHAGDVIRRNYALPDGLWYGAQPKLLVDHRGDGVDAMIDQIELAIGSYPYANAYRSYPGPTATPFSPTSAGRCRHSSSTCPPTRSARTTARSAIRRACTIGQRRAGLPSRPAGRQRRNAGRHRTQHPGARLRARPQ